MPICLRYKANENDAAASLNLAYLKIIEKYTSKKSDVNFIPWAKRITINLLIDEYRQSKSRKSRLISTDPHELHYSSSRQEFNTAELELDAEQIIYYIQKLNEPGRTIFNLHTIEGYSHKEIASKLKMTTENCRYHLHAARKTLQNQLSQYRKLTKPV